MSRRKCPSSFLQLFKLLGVAWAIVLAAASMTLCVGLPGLLKELVPQTPGAYATLCFPTVLEAGIQDQEGGSSDFS